MRLFAARETEFGGNQIDSCRDTTHVNLEIPHYLKGYMATRSFVSYSCLLKQPECRKENLKLDTKLLRIKTEGAVEIQEASVRHQSPEKPLEAYGI